MSLRILSLLCLSSVVASALHPLGGPLTSSNRQNIATQIQMPDPQRRAPAIARFRADGDDAASDLGAALTRSEPVALGNLRRASASLKGTDPTVAALSADLKAYNTLATSTKALVQTDHHKDKKKFAEMDKAFADLEKAHKKVERGLKAQNTLAQFLQSLQWVAEVRRDQARAEKKNSDIATLPMSAVLEVEGADDAIKTLVREVEPFIALRELHRVTSAAHAQMKWARPEQVQYAEILNERRVILGLRPYLLAEKLSLTCEKHSEEMVKLKYFAHESPVTANKTFGDRVRNSGFEGNGSGECIYAGGSAPAAAHTGWWYSDGHRLILYANGSNAQGIAKFATTWTFLTGSFAAFPL